MAMRAPGGAGVRRPRLERQAVLGVEVDVGGVGKHAEAGRRRSAPRAVRTPSSNSDTSPRNLLIAKPRNSARSSGVSRCDRAEDRGEHAAALDVGDEQPRRADRA